MGGFFFIVPKEKFKTHDDEPDKKETPSKKKPKTKLPSTSKPSPPIVHEYYFKDFRKLCMNLSQENSYLQKTAIIKEWFDKILSKGAYHYSIVFIIRIWIL